MIVLTRSFPIPQLFIAICITASTPSLGCGQLPQGPVSATSFMVSGFTLSPQMVYSESNAARTIIPTISGNEQMAKRFMEGLVMNAVTNKSKLRATMGLHSTADYSTATRINCRTLQKRLHVNDVLEQQGRNAFLSDAVISLILQQLNVTVNYTPLNCKTASNDPANTVIGAARPVMPDGCFIISDVVSSLCTMADCMHSPVMHIKPVPSEFMSFTGSVTTSNVIMANWSPQMWQSILNRVHQRLTSGQFRRYFSGAVITANN